MEPQDHKSIVHFDLDTFYVSCERLQNSSLIGKPVLIGGTSDRGVVASCSYEAREYGIHSGMAMKIARRLCPEAIAIRGDSGTYSKYSGIVTEIIRDSVPIVEKASIDEFYLDMTGMDQFFGVRQYVTELRERIIKETHLPISMGLSQNKTVSKVATSEAKPCGKMTVDFGREKSFLAPLSVKKLPMVGNETYEVLQELGIQYINTLQLMPQQKLEKVFGKNGITLWQRAQGIDLTPVKPFYERSSLSLERTFDKDTLDFTKLANLITAMAEGLAFQLRLGDKLTACVSVKVRYADMSVEQKQRRIPYANGDHVLIDVAKRLLADLFQKRQLIRLVGMRCTNLVSGGHQMNLLEDSVEMVQLYQKMDYLKKKYRDSRLVMRACGIDQKNIGVWDPWDGEPPTPGAHRHA